MLESSSTLPLKLRVGVIAGLIIAAIGVLNAFTHVLILFLPLAVGVAVVGLCGTFCGITAAVTCRGFHRLVAALAALVCLYALIHCVGFLGWAINLP